MRILRLRASQEYAALHLRLGFGRYLWLVDDIDPWITCVWFA